MRAIRERFPNAKVTALTGEIPGEVVKLSGFADEIIAVDRVELRDGPKPRSIAKIIGLTRSMRSRSFDLVIDLHSLKETNILAWFTGAKHRLLANRGNRSYRSLGNFRPSPPAEDRALQLSRTYMRVIGPLGLDREPEPVVIQPNEDDLQLARSGVLKGAAHPLAGFFPGAGNPSRCWPLERFVRLAESLRGDGYTPVVFLGPEEREMRQTVENNFPQGTLIVDGLNIGQFIAAASELDVFVTNDTGPMHLAALAGAPILLVIDSRAPLTYLPLADKIEVVNNAHIDGISVEDAHIAAQKLLGTRAE